MHKTPPISASISPQPRPEQSPSLLHPGEPPAFEIYNGDGPTPLVIVSDHAGRQVPEKLNTLRLAQHHFNNHIAYDIGTDQITRQLADRLNAPAVIATYSRLVVDLNRHPNDPDCIPDTSDGIAIPGNRNLDTPQIQQRIDDLHGPYHGAIKRQVHAQWQKNGHPPALFSIHSFTPTLNGHDRAWDIGVLWNRDPRLSAPLISHLRQCDGLPETGTPGEGFNVGDNQPYCGREIAYTINTHGGAVGLANCAVEIRQDHCTTPQNINRWADILADALRPALAQAGLLDVRRYEAAE